MLEIYLDPCTINSRKVLAALDALGTKYNYNFIDFFAGGQKDESFVKNVNPSATVPAAVDGDLHLTESNAILQYAADLEGNTDLYPKDLKTRALVNRWLFWEASAWFGSNYLYLIENVVKPDLMGAETDQKALEAEDPKYKNLAKILDEQLGKTKFVACNNITIADIALAACMQMHAWQKAPMDGCENLKRWIGEIEQQGFWKRTQGAVDEKIVPGKGKSFEY